MEIANMEDMAIESFEVGAPKELSAAPAAVCCSSILCCCC